MKVRTLRQTFLDDVIARITSEGWVWIGWCGIRSSWIWEVNIKSWNNTLYFRLAKGLNCTESVSALPTIHQPHPSVWSVWGCLEWKVLRERGRGRGWCRVWYGHQTPGGHRGQCRARERRPRSEPGQWDCGHGGSVLATTRSLINIHNQSGVRLK